MNLTRSLPFGLCRPSGCPNSAGHARCRRFRQASQRPPLLDRAGRCSQSRQSGGTVPSQVGAASAPWTGGEVTRPASLVFTMAFGSRRDETQTRRLRYGTTQPLTRRNAIRPCSSTQSSTMTHRLDPRLIEPRRFGATSALVRRLQFGGSARRWWSLDHRRWPRYWNGRRE